MSFRKNVLVFTIMFFIFHLFTNDVARATDGGSKREAELLARIEQLEKIVAEQTRLLTEKANRTDLERILLNRLEQQEKILANKIEQMERIIAEQSRQLARVAEQNPTERESALQARIEQLEKLVAIQTTKIDAPVQDDPDGAEEARETRLRQLEKAVADAGEKKLSFNLTAEAGYGRTNGNNYTVGNKAGSYQNPELGIVVTARPYDFLTFAARTEFEKTTARIDWAFVELRQSDALRFRIGQVKQPFGIYGEVIDIGTLRPFFSLPESIYGPANLTADHYDGLGITGNYEFRNGWGVSYDLFGGLLELESSEPFKGTDTTSRMRQGRKHIMKINRLKATDDDDDGGDEGIEEKGDEIEEEQVKDAFGGRLMIRTPINGLSFGFSGYRGKNQEEAVNQNVYGFSFEYLTSVWNIRSEYFRANEGALERNRAGYIEAARFFGPHWQLAGRYERSYTQVSNFVRPEQLSLLEHRDLAVGVNYWFNPGLVMKFGYHRVNGNRFARPADLNDALLNNSLKKQTNLFEAGMQFSF